MSFLSSSTARTQRREDAAFGLLLALLAALVYALTFQDVLLGDGPEIVNTYASKGWRAMWLHVLYLPAANVLRTVLPSTDPAQSLRALSVLSGAALVAATFWAARAVSHDRVASVWAALVTAATPAVWIQATSIEVHALQGAVATAALACALYLPRRFGGRGVAIAAVVAGASYLAHTSNALLFPGLALATFHAWRAADEPPRPVAAGLRAASSLAVALVLAVGVADVVRRGAGVPFRTGGIPEFLADFDVRDLGVLTELLALSGVLLAAAALALAGKRLPAHLAWTCAVLVLPYLFLIWWFGRTERGGYLVATIPVLALAGAGSFGANRVVRGCLWLALAGQVLLGVRALEETRGVVNPDERAERRDLVAHALPDGGVLVSFDPTRQTVQADLPGVREVNLQGVLGSAAKRGVPPAEFVAQVTAAIAELLSTDPGRVALDASYRGWVGAAPALAAYTELLDEEVSRSFRTEELASGRWVIVELSPR